MSRVAAVTESPAIDQARWMHVRALFERLLDADQQARSLVLAEARAKDPAVAREAQALLDQHEAEEAGGGTFLAQPATMPVGVPEADLHARRHHGRRLGPWRLAALLGEGGMGQVWEAFRADGRYDARVALKIIKPGVDSQVVLERFALEQRSLARLNHPHIARLLDAGLTDDGAPYFVLEAVQGQPIDAACAGLPLRQRVRLFLQLVDAVAFAHRHLLVHRDLKPGNVLVSEDGQVKLLDFGIARALVGDEAEDGSLLGLTPAFASPEQVRGAPVGTATDIYSLGLLLHLMLTGTRAYAREARSTSAALRAVLDEAPVAPSEAPAGQSDPGVPRRALRGDIDAIVARCLQKGAEARYPSADALAMDLRAWLDGRDVQAATPTPWRSAMNLLRRHRAASGAGLLALVVALLALGTQAWQAREAAAALALLALVGGIGVSAWQARQAAAARDHALQRLDDTRQIARDIVMRYADTISYLPGGLQLKASLLTDTVAHLERLAQLHAGASADAALAGDLALAHARLADVQDSDTDLTLNDPAACQRNTERALALFPRGESAHRDDPRYLMWWARAMHNKARAARASGDADTVLLWYQRRRDLLQLGLPRHPDNHDLRHELGSTLIGIGQAYDTWARTSLERPQAAADAYAEAQQIFTALVDANPSDSVALHQLGVIHGGRMLSLFKQARIDEAVAEGRQGVNCKRQALALEPGHVAYRQALSGECNNLAMVLNDARRFADALPLAQEAVDLLRVLERDDPQMATWTQRRRYFSWHLGRALLGSGQAAAALAPLLDCLVESAGATDRAQRRRRGFNHLLLAQAHAALGDRAAAAASAQAARAELEGVLSDDTSDIESCLVWAELLCFEPTLAAPTPAADQQAQLTMLGAQEMLAKAVQRNPLRPHGTWVTQQVEQALQLAGRQAAAGGSVQQPAAPVPPPAPPGPPEP